MGRRPPRGSLDNITGYIANPALATGLLVATTADDPDLRRWFDDVVPVLQAGIVTGVVNQAAKLIFARRRPFAEFHGESVQKRKGDVETSFFSGHAALAFAMATSSGTVARCAAIARHPRCGSVASGSPRSPGICGSLPMRTTRPT